ncbi:MAG: fibronectin type III domain-containing protein, partial [Candidatus Eisenbacteria sp.]|nr:fibronectin type III domain-containing protein [Candidatus Eisenbacteria bacterium]
GETIRLRLTLANEGDDGADSVQMCLQTIASTPEDEGTPAGFAEFIDSTAVIESLAAGSEQACDAFLFSIASCPPEETWGEGDMIRLPLALRLEVSGQSLTRTLCFEVARPVLDVAMNQEGESGQENVAKVWLGLINKGKGTASHLMARMEDFEYLTAEPSGLGIREIEPGDTALVGPLLLTYEPAHQSEAQFTFAVIDTFLEPDQILHARTVDLQRPDPPDSLIVKGHASDDMLLYWSEAEDPGGGEVIGYKVLRAPVESGIWVEVSHGILQDHRYAMDIGLDPRTEYQYGVRSVDAGGNVGFPSAIVSGFTRPAMLEGWPHELGISQPASPLICELDHIVDGFGGVKYREIIFGGDGLYAFHGNGSEVVNGDGNVFTTGPFSAPEYEGDEFWAKAAVGDLDGDGMTELVAISKTNEYVGCWSRGGGSPNWTYDLSERISIAWNSPALADLDKNGTLEVIFCAGEKNHEGLFVLDCNGQPFKAGTDGRLTDFEDRFLYQSPAVGYVDSNDDLDIVLLLRNRKSLRVVDGKTGEDVPGFEGGLKYSDLGASTDTRGNSAASLADVDGDGMDEIFMVLYDRLWCIEYEEDLFGQGEAVLVWEALLDKAFDDYDVQPEPVIGELNADYAGPEVALVESQGKLWVWNATNGEIVDGFPVQVGPGGSTRFGSSILANVDEDSRPEIVFADNAKQIHAYTWEGKPAAGFPLPFGGLPLMQSLAAWDVDGDGYQNLVGQAKEDLTLYVYDLATVPFDPADNPWPMRHRDSVNSNRFTPAEAVGIRVTLEEAHVDGQGCVHLAWSSGEAVQAFFILRSGPDGGSAVLIGEVPGKGGCGVQHYAFDDSPGTPGTYQYSIKVVLSDGHTLSGPRATVLVPSAGGMQLALHRAGPNPLLCGKPVDVAFGIPGGAGSEVSTKLRVLDPQGRVVRVILDESLPAGTHCLEWDGRDGNGQMLSSGLYLMRLEAAGRSVHRRVLMVK